jgi:uncharacterized membrane protein SirB2
VGFTMKRLSPPARRAVLTVHIVASVALLGTSAALVAILVRASTTTDPALANSGYELLGMFPVLFGIPLSMTSLLSGLVLGLGGKWGVLRYRWVTIKLVLILSVIVLGATVLGPRTAPETVLVLAGAWDVLALTLATCLSVYKPSRLLQRNGGLARRASPSA